MATGTTTRDLQPVAAKKPPPRKKLRRLSNVLIGVGVFILLYCGLILWWGDPVTWLYAQYQQRGLTTQLHQETQRFQNEKVPASDTAALALVRKQALAFGKTVHNSQAVGRLEIGRIGLSVVVVQGTDWGSDLSKGPGHYSQTPMPGLGTTIGIAGHRTTFGAWFRHIDSIRNGDWITLQMPYATFHYQVQYHQVVASNDWAIIKPHGYERLILSACHPLYSASHRWVVFARAMNITLPNGRTLNLASRA